MTASMSCPYCLRPILPTLTVCAEHDINLCGVGDFERVEHGLLLAPISTSSFVEDIFKAHDRGGENLALAMMCTV